MYIYIYNHCTSLNKNWSAHVYVHVCKYIYCIYIYIYIYIMYIYIYTYIIYYICISIYSIYIYIQNMYDCMHASVTSCLWTNEASKMSAEGFSLRAVRNHVWKWTTSGDFNKARHPEINAWHGVRAHMHLHCSRHMQIDTDLWSVLLPYLPSIKSTPASPMHTVQQLRKQQPLPLLAGYCDLHPWHTADKNDWAMIDKRNHAWQHWQGTTDWQ